MLVREFVQRFVKGSSVCTLKIKKFGQLGYRPSCFFLLYSKQVEKSEILGGNYNGKFIIEKH